MIGNLSQLLDVGAFDRTDLNFYVNHEIYKKYELG